MIWVVALLVILQAATQVSLRAHKRRIELLEHSLWWGNKEDQ
jgi:hypothetical protein